MAMPVLPNTGQRPLPRFSEGLHPMPTGGFQPSPVTTDPALANIAAAMRQQLQAGGHVPTLPETNPQTIQNAVDHANLGLILNGLNAGGGMQPVNPGGSLRQLLAGSTAAARHGDVLERLRNLVAHGPHHGRLTHGELPPQAAQYPQLAPETLLALAAGGGHVGGMPRPNPNLAY